MMRIVMPVAALGAALALSACNANDGMSGPVASAPPPPVAMSLPQGAACSKEINTYETVLKGDLATGNVEEKVYDQIQTEMARAASACSAGKGGEAHAIVASSKAKHGYRA